MKLQITVKIILCHSRFFDEDNAHGACKDFIDVIKEQRFLFDDRPEFMHLIVEQRKTPHKQRHTILCIGIDPGEQQ